MKSISVFCCAPQHCHTSPPLVQAGYSTPSKRGTLSWVVLCEICWVLTHWSKAKALPPCKHLEDSGRCTPYS